MSFLEVKDLKIGYDGKVVVENINFCVNKGDYLCIVGENGSGKTTLMKTLLKIKSPLGGSIVLGDDLKRNEIGYLSQQNAIQKDFPASVEEVVSSGCQNSMGWRPYLNKAERKLVSNNMQKLGIEHLAKSCYRELSGGQQQRVLIARALCATKKMLFLDEPVTGLDPKITAETYEIISNVNKTDGITVVMISHDIAMATKYATHILHLSQNPLFFGTKQEYLLSDIGKVFCGMEDK